MARHLVLAILFVACSPRASLSCSVLNTSATPNPGGVSQHSRRLSALSGVNGDNAPGAAAAASALKSAYVFAEIEDSGPEPFRDVLHDASTHFGLKLCGMECEQRERWHRNSKWRQACRMLVGGYVMGTCPGQAYFTGDAWIPCKTIVALRHPVDRVLSTYVSCQADSKQDKCASEYLDASVVGYRRWAEHHKNFVLLRLAQDRDNVLGPEHRDACANPAGCLHNTPCWYKHHQHVELDGTAYALQQKAEARLKEANVVAIYERFVESLYLMECKTGFSTLGHRHRRVAVPHPNAGKPGYPDATTSGRMAPEDLDKFERWRSLMRKDPEVLAILQREMVVYNAAWAIFEAQLKECGIVRNGSKITMDRTASGHVRKQPSSALAGALASQGHRAGGTAAAMAFATDATKREAEAAVGALVQQVHAKRGNHHPALQSKEARSGAAGSAATVMGPSGVALTPQQLLDFRAYQTASRSGRSGFKFGDSSANAVVRSKDDTIESNGWSPGHHIPITEKRRVRGGLSRLHMERFPTPELH